MFIASAAMKPQSSSCERTVIVCRSLIERVNTSFMRVPVRTISASSTRENAGLAAPWPAPWPAAPWRILAFHTERFNSRWMASACAGIACSAGAKVVPVRRMARTRAASVPAPVPAPVLLPVLLAEFAPSSSPAARASSPPCSNAVASGTSTSALQPDGPM